MTEIWDHSICQRVVVHPRTTMKWQKLGSRLLSYRSLRWSLCWSRCCATQTENLKPQRQREWNPGRCESICYFHQWKWLIISRQENGKRSWSEEMKVLFQAKDWGRRTPHAGKQHHLHNSFVHCFVQSVAHRISYKLCLNLHRNEIKNQHTVDSLTHRSKSHTRTQSTLDQTHNRFEGCLTMHLPHEIIWNANLMQQGDFINVFLAWHV